MIKIKKEDCLFRPEDIKPSSSDFEVIGVINPAAVRLDDGTIFLYIRVIEKLINNNDEKYRYSPRMVGKKEFKVKIEKFKKDDILDGGDLDFVFKNGNKRLTFISHFRKVILDKNGFNILYMDKNPSFYGTKDDGELGVEDARITKIEGKYVMTYVSLSRTENVSTSLAISTDCESWRREGVIFNEQDKDVVIFPERVNNRYVALDRPEGNFQFSAPHIWIAYSKDIKSWGNLKPLPCLYEEDGYCPKNGAGPPPIKTKKGWLLLFHTITNRKVTDKELELLQKVQKIADVDEQNIREVPIYSVGAALFDLNDPEKILGKSDEMIMIPRREYDIGTFENKRVTFPTGIVAANNEKDVLIYSGGGDRVVTVRKISLSEILSHIKPTKMKKFSIKKVKSKKKFVKKKKR